MGDNISNPNPSWASSVFELSQDTAYSDWWWQNERENINCDARAEIKVLLLNSFDVI